MALTSIISVNYNQPLVTLEFLRSVRAHLPAAFTEVILVDNGSVEDYGDDFKKCYPGLKYIRSESNLGFAGGNNLGVKEAGGEYILMLNNDTEVIPGLIDQLVKEMKENPEIGIISPLIYYFDNPSVIQYAGFTEMNYLTCRNKAIGFMEENDQQYNQISGETGYCHGAAMMCKKADLLAIGAMAEQYFLYYEELDWCEQFKRAGKKIWFTGKTHIFHKESMSVGKESSIKTFFMTRNRMLFIRRNTGAFNTAIFTCYYLLIVAPREIFRYLLKGKKELAAQVIKGLRWNLNHSKESRDIGYKPPN
ncbi:glycosyltransferase family 2 protein [Pedobacter frigidisoli]|uniref:Glycosyltransferase family 2 protein n=1 Tax=Pedobacter frigidisoli TaxID=2530455 RepID=A0A4V2MLH6_9SPHI|nr:glycosyltransferase family 2 protein [Pedobacter frigidisoli]TCD02007.1 glycosyltransferase family 2 protein [Pedobacter frigidisoli]